METKLINFIDLSKNDLLEILEWRNNKFVRLKMNNNHIISSEEHFKFIEKLHNNTKSMYFLVLHNKEKIGVIDLNDIENGHACLGLYKNPASKIKKSGIILMEAIFNLAFSKSINKLSLQVLRNNTRAINLYKDTGFKIIDKNKDSFFMEKFL